MHMHTAQVTAILYANPGWCPADGGKLRLWPPRTLEAAPSTATSGAGALPAFSDCLFCQGHIPCGRRAPWSPPPPPPPAAQARCLPSQTVCFVKVISPVAAAHPGARPLHRHQRRRRAACLIRLSVLSRSYPLWPPRTLEPAPSTAHQRRRHATLLLMSLDTK